MVGGGPSGGVPPNSNICVMIKQTRHGNNIPNWICSRSLLVENYIDLFKRRTKKSVLFTEKILIKEFMGNWKLQCLKRFPSGYLFLKIKTLWKVFGFLLHLFDLTVGLLLFQLSLFISRLLFLNYECHKIQFIKP